MSDSLILPTPGEGDDEADYSLIFFYFGAMVTGDVLEMDALYAEFPDSCLWDGTNKDRHANYIVDPINRKMRPLPHWVVLPIVAAAHREGWM